MLSYDSVAPKYNFYILLIKIKQEIVNSIYNKTILMNTMKLLTTLFIGLSLMACQGESSAEIALDNQTYTVLPQPIPVSTGDKVEVMELFWYGCSHCFALEPYVNNWKKKMPANAELVKVPAIFSARWEFHGKAFYTMETLGILEEAHDAFFHQIHIKRKPLNTLGQLIAFLSKYGKSEDEITSAFNSFAVDSKLRNAKKITAKSTATGVPAILVDGKFHTAVGLAGSPDKLFKVVDQLIDKAASER